MLGILEPGCSTVLVAHFVQHEEVANSNPVIPISIVEDKS